MLEVIEYLLEFTYEIKNNNLNWFDDFICDSVNQIVRINSIKNIEKSYMGKTPKTELKSSYKIAIFRKNKWVIFNENKGETIVDDKKKIEINGMEINECKYTPVLSTFTFNYDLQTLLTLIEISGNGVVIEHSKIALIEGKVKYKKLEITINGSVISYRGKEGDKFKEICKELKKLYLNEHKKIKYLMSLTDKPEIEAKNTHKAIAYKTWYNAKRENQREWPYISRTSKENSLEFPRNSGIYYYYPNKYIGLAIRRDINNELYIPKVYNTDYLKNENSITYKYVNNIEIKIDNIDKFRKIKELEDEKYQEIDHNGVIISSNLEAEVIVYNEYIIKYIDFKEKEIFKAQILDKKNRRVMILNENNEWVKSEGHRILEIPALPYNYRQIIHDYKKLGRLRKGKIMDLTHIGVIKEDSDDIITFPETKGISISKCLETHRNMTCKFIKNNEIKIIYNN